MSAKRLFDLGGSVAPVTGGSRRLGLQMAEALAERGCRIAISARKADELASAKSECSASAQRCMSSCSICNNTTAPLFLAREIGRLCMIPRRHGKIINVASIAGLR